MAASESGRLPSGARHGPRKIVVIDLGFLGDTVHLIPALWELRRHHPNARLDVVTTRVGAEVLSLAPCVDQVWVYPLGHPSPPWWRHLGLQCRLAQERFDLAMNFSGADRTLWVTAFTAARRRVIRQPPRTRWWHRWVAGTTVAPPPRTLPVFEQRRQVLAAAGYPLEPARFDLRLPNDDLAWATARVPAGAVHLSINASSPLKEWPVERWLQFARLLLDRGATAVVATGSPAPREQARLNELAAGLADPRLIVLSERLSIPRLAAVVARCHLHAGTDSGVTHLAMALGLPTVSVFREYDGLDEWRPRGPLHAAITAPCRCVDRPTPQPDCLAANTALCLAQIPSERLVELATALAPSPPATQNSPIRSA